MPSPKLTGSGGDRNEATIATVQTDSGATFFLIVVSFKYARARAFVGFKGLTLFVLLNGIAHHRWLTKSTGNMKC